MKNLFNFDPTPKREVVEQGGGYLVTVTPPPELGFKASSLLLTPGQYRKYERWLKDKSLELHNLLPELSVDDQEILISGIGKKDWDNAFGDED